MKGFEKYRRQYFMPPEPCLEWTKKEYIEEAPIWCSVDLRDGNQSLIIPMSLEEKLEFSDRRRSHSGRCDDPGADAGSRTHHQAHF